MQWTHDHYEQIKHLLPKQRGNVEIDNQTFFSAMIHLTENGLRWRAMPEKYGKWNSIYRRFRCPLLVGRFSRRFAGRTEIDGGDTVGNSSRQTVVDG